MLWAALRPPADPSRATGETMLLLAVALGLLLLLVVVVVLSMSRRHREQSSRRPPPTVVRDAWREAGRRARVERSAEGERDDGAS